MHDARDRRHRARERGEQRRELLGVGDVDRLDADLDAHFVEPGQHRPRRLALRAGAAEQDDMARAAVGEPERRLRAESAETAGDDMRARGIHLEGDALASRGDVGRGRTHQDLADVPRLLHQPHRLDDFTRLVDAVGQRREFAGREQRQHFAEQFARELGTLQQQLVEIDAEIGEVATERPEPDGRVGEIVALAEFDEAPERFEQADAALHRLARERVEHDADAAVPGRAPHVVDEGAGARIERVFRAERERQVALLRASRRSRSPARRAIARSAAPRGRRRRRRHESAPTRPARRFAQTIKP